MMQEGNTEHAIRHVLNNYVKQTRPEYDAATVFPELKDIINGY